MIGIFKVNQKYDGGAYIDKYLHRILLRSGKIAVYFHQGHKALEAEEALLDWNYKNMPVAMFQLRKIVKQKELDTVYTNQFIVLFYFALLKKLKLVNARIVAKVDGKTIRLGTVKKLFFFVYDFLWDFAKRNADFVIFETQKAKASWKGNCAVVHSPAVNFYGINLDAETSGVNAIPDKPKTVLFVGRYSEEKGFDRVAELAKVFPEVQFEMAGGKASCFGEITNIKEWGMLDAQRLIPVYARADILLIPSRDDSFPSVVREFAWFGKPMQATDVGAMKEYQEMGVNIQIVENNMEALKAGLREALDADEQASQNKEIYKSDFDPNSESIIQKYCGILGGD
jgi:glycosyltransferase involved in cell wall biosynthesis